MFESIQGGPYNGDDVARLVETIRDFGIDATGQSSWGPCVFSICPDVTTAEKLIDSLSRVYGQQCEFITTFADNAGARTKVLIAN